MVLCVFVSSYNYYVNFMLFNKIVMREHFNDIFHVEYVINDTHTIIYTFLSILAEYYV